MVLAPISQALGLRVACDNDRPKFKSSVRSGALDFRVGQEVRAQADDLYPLSPIRAAIRACAAPLQIRVTRGRFLGRTI
jgi:hypothetical protein